MKKKILNTETKDAHFGWLADGNPDAIVAQEAQGQKELVESQQLPKRCNDPRGVNAAEQYSKMGIKVLVPSKGDDLFLGVTLPKGWEKKATDRSMWSKLIDDKGRVRASFFYKAAFYDRDSFINFETRYQQSTDYSEDRSYCYCVKDTATGEIIFKTEKMPKDCKAPDYFQKQDSYRGACLDFLNTNFPNWEDINAYWD